jgi:hypothetical protein
MIQTTVTTRMTSMATLRNHMRQTSSTKYEDDNRFWKPEVDTSGIGFGVIRFLPAKLGEEFPFVKMYTHCFRGATGKWFMDKCPTSINEECPACQANSALWQSGIESNRNIARSRKRKLNYISNILVISDPKHPENNGKVFLFRYGTKLFNMLAELVDPLYDDSIPFDPFDLEEGATCRLRVKRVEGFSNYDSSTFDSPTPIGDEHQIEELMSHLYALEPFRDPSHFKSYGELASRFARIVGKTSESVQGDRESTVASAESPRAKSDSEKSTDLAPLGKTARPTPEEPVDLEDEFSPNLAQGAGYRAHATDPDHGT